MNSLYKVLTKMKIQVILLLLIHKQHNKKLNKIHKKIRHKIK